MDCPLNDKLIRSIQDIGSKYAIKRIVIFGSRARGDHKSTSDIDLAIYPLADFMNKGHFSSEIDDLATLLKIDVVFITVLREAFAAGMIEKDELWLAMLSDRNTTAHIYSEQLAIEICSKIIKEYVCEFNALKEKIIIRTGIQQ